LEIWNRKQIGRIYDAYRHNAQVHTPECRLYGREEIIRHVTSRMAAFPDMSCHIEDIIDVVRDRGPRDRFELAVRWTMTGRNTGHSIHGPPTGLEATLHGMSHYCVRGDRIVEAWVVDNELSVVRQLGFEPSELVPQLVAGDAFGCQQWGEVERVFGQTTPAVMALSTGEEFDIDDFIRRGGHEIWNWRLLGTMDENYAEDAVFHGPSDRKLVNRDDYKAYVLSMLAAFPDLARYIDDLLWCRDKEGRYRASTRWTLLGTHEGPGPYGQPSGRRVQVSGITDYVVEAGLIVEQWTEFGEFALLKQIHSPAQRSAEVQQEIDTKGHSTDAERDSETCDDTGNGNAKGL
jgi:predicted ester cyclase